MTKAKIDTMEQLAEAIGVSRPTLSRFFQDPSSVRGTTSEKIRKGLDRVDYVPNFFATRLNRKNTGVIGVIVPHLRDLFFTSLIEEIERAAYASDYTVITQSSQGRPEIETKAAERFLSMNADGVIVAPLGETSALAALQRLSASTPLVFVDSHLPEALPGTDFVGTDNYQSIGVIVEYLCRTGPAPVFLSMPPLNSNSFERETAYIHHCKRLGLEPHVIPADIQAHGWDFEAYGHGVMDRHFGRGSYQKSTILCANDRLAIGVVRAAQRHGLLKVNDDSGVTMRIAGHDDHALSSYMTPSLTTVAQDIRGIGRDAVGLLLQRVRGGAPLEPVRRMLEATLKVRESA